VNLALIPLLIMALLMASGDPGVDGVQLILRGEHQLQDGAAFIVADADVLVPAGIRVGGPIYVIGGTVIVEGEIESDLIQLAGTVTIEDGAIVGDELRGIAGTLVLSPTAEVGRRTSLELASAGADLGGWLAQLALSMLLMAGFGYLLAGKKRRALDNVAAAVTGHPVIALTVGLLLALTTVSLLVFMAFTLVLVPVAIFGLLVGLATLVYADIAWGRLIGSRLPFGHERLATAVGAAGVVGCLHAAARIPLIGDLIVAAVVLTGLGAVVITHFGVTRFRPDVLTD
jgi:hypothetical protein